MQQIKDLEVQKLTLEDKKHLTLSRVEAVDGFSEQCLKLTVSGCKVIILGNNIKITSFNKQTGNLSADGDIFEIKYSHKNQPIIKRLFK